MGRQFPARRPWAALSVLCLGLCVTGCSSSSRSVPVEPESLRRAQGQVDEKLRHPAPPIRLLLCQDGSNPQRVQEVWECPPSPEIVKALQTGSWAEMTAILIGALRKETNLRFQLRAWDWPDAALPAPAPPSKAP